MAKTISPLLPSTAELLSRFGDRLRLARLRRRLTAKQVAERAGMAPMTLRSLERGGPGVTIGAYLAVMQVLGIEKDLDMLAEADPLGRDLQDARLPAHGRTRTRTETGVDIVSPKGSRSESSRAAAARTDRTAVGARQKQPRKTQQVQDAPALKRKGQRNTSGDSQQWVETGGFASSESLADLIKPPLPAKKRR
jgi:transcriptional regulator with XRE-family HTH domain